MRLNAGRLSGRNPRFRRHLRNRLTYIHSHYALVRRTQHPRNLQFILVKLFEDLLDATFHSSQAVTKTKFKLKVHEGNIILLRLTI